MKRKLSALKNSNTQGGFSIGLILRGMVLAFMFSLICFLILAIVLSFSNISESIIRPSSYIVMIGSIVFASGYVAQRVNRNGWMYGAITGLVYIVILGVIGLFTGRGFILDQLLLSRALMGIVAGTIGGILGINLK